jgi:hypothetical protein
MIHAELTDRPRLATSLPMNGRGKSRRGRHPGRRTLGVLVLVAGSMAAAGCISVNAPDKPIVIELNINIKQEVIYRLAGDAAKTIDQNAGIF